MSDWVVQDAARLTGCKSSPLLFANSLGWGRRNYEPDRPHQVLKRGTNNQMVEVKHASTLSEMDMMQRPPRITFSKSMKGPTKHTPVRTKSAGLHRRYFVTQSPTNRGNDLSLATREAGQDAAIDFLLTRGRDSPDDGFLGSISNMTRSAPGSPMGRSGRAGSPATPSPTRFGPRPVSGSGEAKFYIGAEKYKCSSRMAKNLFLGTEVVVPEVQSSWHNRPF